MMKLFLILTVTSFSIFQLFADEGMWMINLLKQQKLSEMHKMGLQLEDYDIYNPDGSSLKDAVVQFGRGCTGEVISSQGLVLTNYHCGYGQIQSHSTLEDNYLDEGFWAMTKEEELSNHGLTVTFIEKIEDVTDYVKQCLIRDEAQDSLGVQFLSAAYLNKIAQQKVGSDFLSNNIGIEVEIKPFYNGNQYYMFTKKIYSDIRLVGAPPSSIGKFGADTDNWSWPRHTGDFALFRIYADEEGNPAPYSTENIPLNPKRWLKISTEGVQEDDFAMMLGFPGTTNKYYTSWEVAERRDIDNSVRINMREVRQNVMLEEMLNNPEIKIQYATKYSGSTNAYKNAIGTNWAIDLYDFEKIKLDQQNNLLNWSKKNNKHEYKEALDEIKRIVNERADLRYRTWMLTEGIIRGVEFASIPYATANRLTNLSDKYDDSELENQINQLIVEYHNFTNNNYNRDVDIKVAKAMIAAYIDNVSQENQPDYFNIIYTQFEGNSDLFVDYIFENSLFGNEVNLQNFISHDFDTEIIKNDPMFSFAKSVMDEAANLNSELSKYEIPFAIARKIYLEGVLAMDDPHQYFPDANLTLRLTYGKVKGYHPRDAVFYTHQTTMDRIFEKEDPDNWEFIVPEKLNELYKAEEFGNIALNDGRMPVNFVATTHTTGGNSGSPVMNGNGELIGINFDRNWEGVGGDIQYLPDYQRSIIVDIRYVLFIIDKFGQASHIINELDLTQQLE